MKKLFILLWGMFLLASCSEEKLPASTSFQELSASQIERLHAICTVAPRGDTSSCSSHYFSMADSCLREAGRLNSDVYACTNYLHPALGYVMAGICASYYESAGKTDRLDKLDRYINGPYRKTTILKLPNIGYKLGAVRSLYGLCNSLDSEFSAPMDNSFKWVTALASIPADDNYSNYRQQVLIGTYATVVNMRTLAVLLAASVSEDIDRERFAGKIASATASCTKIPDHYRVIAEMTDDRFVETVSFGLAIENELLSMLHTTFLLWEKQGKGWSDVSDALASASGRAFAGRFAEDPIFRKIASDVRRNTVRSFAGDVVSGTLEDTIQEGVSK